MGPGTRQPASGTAAEPLWWPDTLANPRALDAFVRYARDAAPPKTEAA